MPVNRIENVSKRAGVARTPKKTRGCAPTGHLSAASRTRFTGSSLSAAAPPFGSSTTDKYAWLMSKVRERLDALTTTDNDITKARAIWLAEQTDDLAASLINTHTSRLLGSRFDDFLKKAHHTGAFTGSDADLSKFIHHLVGEIMAAEIDAKKESTAACAASPVDLPVPAAMRGQTFSWADAYSEEEEDELRSDSSVGNSRTSSPALVGARTPAPQTALTATRVDGGAGRESPADASLVAALPAVPPSFVAQCPPAVLSAPSPASTTASRAFLPDQPGPVSAPAGPAFSTWNQNTTVMYHILLAHQPTQSVTSALRAFQDLSFYACLESPATAFSFVTSNARAHIAAKSSQQSLRVFMKEQLDWLGGASTSIATDREAQLFIQSPTGARGMNIKFAKEILKLDARFYVEKMVAGLDRIWERAAPELGCRTFFKWAERIQDITSSSDRFRETMSFLYQESLIAEEFKSEVPFFCGELLEEVGRRQIMIFHHHFSKKFQEETGKHTHRDDGRIDPLYQKKFFNRMRFYNHMAESKNIIDGYTIGDYLGLCELLHREYGLALN